MRTRTLLAVAIAGLSLSGTDARAQGSLTPPGPPGPSLYSLRHLHNALAELDSGWGIITNALGQMDWNDILLLCQANSVLTQQIHSATSTFARDYWPTLSNAAVHLELITNALSQMDWNDVIALQLTMPSLTQNVAAVKAMFDAVDWNVLTNLSVRIPVMTNALCGPDWQDIGDIRLGLRGLSNRLDVIEMEAADVLRETREENVLLRAWTNAP